MEDLSYQMKVAWLKVLKQSKFIGYYFIFFNVFILQKFVRKKSYYEKTEVIISNPEIGRIYLNEDVASSIQYCDS